MKYFLDYLLEIGEKINTRFSMKADVWPFPCLIVDDSQCFLLTSESFSH